MELAIVSAVSLQIRASPRDLLTAVACLDPGGVCLTLDSILHHRHALGVVKGQIQVIQKPRLGQPSQNHDKTLDIGLTQLDQDLGEKWMRWEGVSPQVRRWQRKGV